MCEIKLCGILFGIWFLLSGVLILFGVTGMNHESCGIASDWDSMSDLASAVWDLIWHLVFHRCQNLCIIEFNQNLKVIFIIKCIFIIINNQLSYF